MKKINNLGRNKKMSDKQLDNISKKLDVVIKLLAFNLIKDKPIIDQVDILTKIGIKVTDIADVVGRSKNQIYVTQITLRKKQKTNKDSTESKEA